jgi:hypothetical protein
VALVLYISTAILCLFELASRSPEYCRPRWSLAIVSGPTA